MRFNSYCHHWTSNHLRSIWWCALLSNFAKFTHLCQKMTHLLANGWLSYWIQCEIDSPLLYWKIDTFSSSDKENFLLSNGFFFAPPWQSANFYPLFFNFVTTARYRFKSSFVCMFLLIFSVISNISFLVILGIYGIMHYSPFYVY